MKSETKKGKGGKLSKPHKAIDREHGMRAYFPRYPREIKTRGQAGALSGTREGEGVLESEPGA